jgi:hypothetical protein
MPWENTEQHIRSGHRGPEEFQECSLKTITLNEKEGIKAVIGKPKGKDADSGYGAGVEAGAAVTCGLHV